MTSRARNPSRKGYLSESPWVPHRLNLLLSPAWKLRPAPLARLLQQLEIEHLRHAGRENGNLGVTYRQFVEAGISRKNIRATVALGEELRLLEVRRGEDIVSDIRPLNRYRLTYLPERGKRAPTDEWEDISEDRAVSAVAKFQGDASDRREGKRRKQMPSSPSSVSSVPLPADAHVKFTV